MTLLSALRDVASDVRRSASSPSWRQSVRDEMSVAKRALLHTAPRLARGPQTLVAALLDNARVDPDGLAVEMDDTLLTWADFARETEIVARALIARGVKPGDVVALFAHGSPRYVVLTLGIARAGATAALVNPHVRGAPLAHAIASAAPKLCVASEELAEHVDGAVLEGELTHAEGGAPLPRVRAGSDFLYIYTSGTTGHPKPCRVGHARCHVAGATFGPLVFGFEPGDKLYCTLPLYHSSGMLIAVGSCIVTRTPLALRPHFSVTSFWSDVRRYDATAFIYIGELCRYLLNAPPSEAEKGHRIRVIAGNGLRPDVWEAFAARFGIAKIREFYGATEAPGALVNFSGKVGSIGRLPLRRLTPMVLARYDTRSGEHLRNGSGFCVPCKPGEVGELLVRLSRGKASSVTEFRGYTNAEDSKKKILRDVFRAGDRYYRSGDLLTHDADGFFYFVDRIGDTFRFKGENVSTTEVSEVLSSADGVDDIAVVGVEVPGVEGRAGLAVIAAQAQFDPARFAKDSAILPFYARPRFLRLVSELPLTHTQKVKKAQLSQDGVDPARVSDPMYVFDGEGYVALTRERWAAVVDGRMRL